MRATAVLLLVAARAACLTLTVNRGGEGVDYPRYVNHLDRLPPVAVLDAADVPLGTVTVTIAGRNVTDDNVLRAVVLSGLASATDWLSVDDVYVAAIDVAAAKVTRVTVPSTSTPCGTSAPSLTYTIALVPAVLPTATQAQQLIDGMAKEIGKQLSRARLTNHRVVATDVRLDAKLYAARPAPFPFNAQAGSDNVLTGWLRAVGYGMNLCDAGLPAIRNLRRRFLVDWQKTANVTLALVGDRPSGRKTLANTRCLSVLPQTASNGAALSFDPAADVLDMQIVVTGLTKEHAVYEAGNTTRLAPGLARFLATPGLSAASVQTAADRRWLYNGHDVVADPAPVTNSAAFFVAAVWVPALTTVALAVCSGVFITRRWLRARKSVARVTALAAKGLGKTPGSSGSGKPSDILRAVGDAAPAASDPLARLATVQWEIHHADLEVWTDDNGAEVVLGQGSSGLVIRGRYAEQDVAIKILTKRDDGGRGLEDLAKEIVMLRACRHPNIVSFVGASIRDGVPPILVVELMTRGDLYRALDNRKWASVFTWQRLMEGGRPRPYTGMNRRIALDVARGLSYLHSRGIVHLDVKSSNVLLANDLGAKLADVGAARALGDAAAATLTSPAGTLAWMAPEVWTEERATDKADVYSLGVVLWELSTGERPRRPLPPVSDDQAPAAVRALIESCLAPDPADRPTAAAVVASLEAMDDDGHPVSRATRTSSATLDSTLATMVARMSSGD